MADQKTSDNPPKDRKRILLVDDDREIIESMRIALEAAGYEILVARDGNQGLALAEREDPDLVILDMMMPKRSGFLVLEKLRRTRRVPPCGSSWSRPTKAAATRPTPRCSASTTTSASRSPWTG